jgi:hypothetical protein
MSAKGLRFSAKYKRSVFLNLPYDEQFTDLFLAYVVGVCSHRLTPRTTLEIVGGEQRLRRISSLIQSCHYSFHDLSRAEIDKAEPFTPRFNMPFETGLAVMFSLTEGSHTYFIFETDYRRLQKSLSDLGGTDVYAHEGTPEGVLREVSNALINAKHRPTMEQTQQIWKEVKGALPKILKKVGAKTLYSARAFSEIVVVVNEAVKQL